MKKFLGRLLSLVALTLAALAPGVLPAHAQGDEGAPEEHSHAPLSGETKTGDANLADYFWHQSDEAFHAGNYERAIELHKSIVKIDAGDVESYSVAAWLLWSLGQKQEALAHIQRGLNANPNNWLMWSAAGEHYDLQKRESPALLSQAKNAYARAVQLLPKSTDAGDAQMLRRRLAHAAEKANDLHLSLQTWRDLARDFPDDVVDKNNLARVEKMNAELKSQQQRGAFLPVTTVALTALILIVAAQHAAPKRTAHKI